MPDSSTSGALAILAGGGPAPGINAVVAAATIRARLEGISVLGVREGFSRIMAGTNEAITPLDTDDVARIYLRGGSMLGISRANPTADAKDLDRVIDALRSNGVDKLSVIITFAVAAERCASAVHARVVRCRVDGDAPGCGVCGMHCWS